jgi:hypothetical protein
MIGRRVQYNLLYEIPQNALLAVFPIMTIVPVVKPIY